MKDRPRRIQETTPPRGGWRSSRPPGDGSQISTCQWEGSQISKSQVETSQISTSQGPEKSRTLQDPFSFSHFHATQAHQAKGRREGHKSRKRSENLIRPELQEPDSIYMLDKALPANRSVDVAAMASSYSNSIYPNYLDTSPGGQNNALNAAPRSPYMQQQQQQANGNGAGINGLNVGMPMNAGQQMDVNLLYQKVVELSEVLRDNRERTQGIVAGAEELAVCLVPMTMGAR